MLPKLLSDKWFDFCCKMMPKLFFRLIMKYTRQILIIFLALMAGINFYLDHQETRYVLNMILCSVATVLPSLISYLVADKTVFSIKKVNIYKVSADFILMGSVSLWFYLLFIRGRPDFYEGASHLYVATWPILIGLIAVVLYIGCLVIQSIILSTFKT